MKQIQLLQPVVKNQPRTKNSVEGSNTAVFETLLSEETEKSGKPTENVQPKGDVKQKETSSENTHLIIGFLQNSQCPAIEITQTPPDRATETELDIMAKADVTTKTDIPVSHVQTAEQSLDINLSNDIKMLDAVVVPKLQSERAEMSVNPQGEEATAEYETSNVNTFEKNDNLQNLQNNMDIFAERNQNEKPPQLAYVSGDIVHENSVKPADIKGDGSKPIILINEVSQEKVEVNTEDFRLNFTKPDNTNTVKASATEPVKAESIKPDTVGTAGVSTEKVDSVSQPPEREITNSENVVRENGINSLPEEKARNRQTETSNSFEVESNGVLSGKTTFIKISDSASQIKGKSESLPVSTQLTDTIKVNLIKGINEFKMQLLPEGLGEIEIKLKAENGLLKVEIMALNPKTQNLLASSSDEIRTILKDNSFDHVWLEVKTESNQQNQDYTEQHGENAQNSQQNQEDKSHKNQDDVRITTLSFLSLIRQLQTE